MASHSMLLHALVCFLVSSSASASNADDESYASHFRRRVNAIWEAATGPIPTAVPETLAAAQGGEHGDSARPNTAATSNAANLKGAGLGYHLHQIGDATGAELTCLKATESQSVDGGSDDDVVEAWACLGEARLALHRAAYAKASKVAAAASGGGSSIVYRVNMSRAMSKLSAAGDSFERAIAADPTHARSRAGLGLSMLLMATRASACGGPQEAKEVEHFISTYLPSSDGNFRDEQDRERDRNRMGSMLTSTTAQLLFDAAQYLEAVTDTTSSSFSLHEPLHIATVHNLALAHLALGDASSAIPLLRRAADYVATQMSSRSTGIGSPEPAELLTSEEVNLGSALLEVGMTEEAVGILSDIAERCCKNESSTDMSTSGAADKRKTSLCSIVYNNLGVGYEMMNESALALSNYEFSVGMSSNAIGTLNMNALCGRQKDSAVLSPILVEDDLSITYDKNAADPKSNVVGHGEKSGGDVVDSQWKAAIEVLQTAALLNPGNSRAWLSLSKARGHA